MVPGCEACGGVLKPDVVFFGENVPKPRVERCYAAVDALDPSADALLVLGSSLTVMSGFRFVRRAAKRGVPVVVVNRGSTRADDLPVVKLDHGTSEFLSSLAALPPGQVMSRRRESSTPRPASTSGVAEQHQAAGPPGQVVEQRAAR